MEKKRFCCCVYALAIKKKSVYREELSVLEKEKEINNGVHSWEWVCESKNYIYIYENICLISLMFRKWGCTRLG